MLIEETKKHLRGDASGLMLLFDFKLPRSGLVQQALSPGYFKFCC
jgi:hypothetical protein